MFRRHYLDVLVRSDQGGFPTRHFMARHKMARRLVAGMETGATQPKTEPIGHPDFGGVSCLLHVKGRLGELQVTRNRSIGGKETWFFHARSAFFL